MTGASGAPADGRGPVDEAGPLAGAGAADGGGPHDEAGAADGGGPLDEAGPVDGSRVVRVLLVDDDALVRAGLTMMLGAFDDIEVVGAVGDGSEVAAAVGASEPHVVLMDIRMPGVDGLTAAEALRARPGAPEVIVLTTFDTDEHVLRALRAGAGGFLLKHTPPAEIARAVRRVAAGEPMLSPEVLRRVMTFASGAAGPQREASAGPQGESPAGSRGEAAAGSRGGVLFRARSGVVGGAAGEAEREARRVRARAALTRLSPGESDVAGLVAQGRTNQEIGTALRMSTATVKAYVSRILTKLDLTNRVQVAILIRDAE